MSDWTPAEFICIMKYLPPWFINYPIFISNTQFELSVLTVKPTKTFFLKMSENHDNLLNKILKP